MAYYSADQARRVRFTLPADSIMLPQTFTLDPEGLSLPAPTDGSTSTSANDPTPASNTVTGATNTDGGTVTDGPPGFTPEQQAWIEGLVRSATASHSPVPTSSASSSLPPPLVPRVGNIGKQHEFTYKI